ncbi:MAG: cupin domain-containing protein [Gammaproteobacteria bacterium]|nr:cupin domain-containing protein [Gammaproteobacteria bacterium]MDH5308515.1 cupin domain-containing protein [Gammaproteobacteria bacterium]
MSELRIFSDDDSGKPRISTSDRGRIADLLAARGVRFEQWDAGAAIRAGDPQDKVIAAYREDIDRLMADEGYQTVDVVSMAPDHPDKKAFRQKFLAEHTHSDDEVRFFVDGHGLFSLHLDNEVYEVLCEKGDLISVPANTRHWFDMGPNPRFVAIRLFNNPEGWVANFTGADIAERFNRLDN